MVKNFLLAVLQYLRTIGIDPVKMIYSLRGLPSFIIGYVRIRRQVSRGQSAFTMGRLYPCLEDRYRQSGEASGHYFHQDLLVSQLIFANNPEKHVDVGSRVDGFVAHVAAFRQIDVIDIRVLTSDTENISYRQLDLMNSLPEEFIECTDSVSCLHALEHFGLGRYGDPINVDGHEIGFDNLVSMLCPEGKLYLSVPIGPQRIEFNAHRVFSISYLLDMFSARLQLDNFSFVDDAGRLHKNVVLDERAALTNCGCKYGCGIFQLTRKADSFDTKELAGKTSDGNH